MAAEAKKGSSSNTHNNIMPTTILETTTSVVFCAFTMSGKAHLPSAKLKIFKNSVAFVGIKESRGTQTRRGQRAGKFLLRVSCALGTTRESGFCRSPSYLISRLSFLLRKGSRTCNSRTALEVVGVAMPCHDKNN